jgi:DNA-binding NtrC family response regulator
MYIQQAKILAVGITDKSTVLKQLPAKILFVDRACQAVNCLRQTFIHTLASRWNLVDMANGQLLMRVINAKPEMPTLALIEVGNIQQEIAARKLGVSIVLPEDVDDGQFYDSVCHLLGLRQLVSISSGNLSKQFEKINQKEESQLLLSPIFSSTPSWVCQSASDRSVADPAEIKRGIELPRLK